MQSADLDAYYMQRALDLAAAGRGHVEPNPLVGCVIANGSETVGEGYHRRFGGPHAEIEALEDAGSRARGATLYVTLEPCCHSGKTPPCAPAVVSAGIARVVIADRDPFPKVAGGGIAQLRAAGIEVEVGALRDDARRLNAPYLKRLATGLPWVIAKWAMTLDGHTAAHTGDSRWISSPESRAAAHGIRGRVDAIIVGRRTAELDDPLLTARPPGPRIATRIVLDSKAQLSAESQLVRTLDQAPVLVVTGPDAPEPSVSALTAAGCEVLVTPETDHSARLRWLLAELGRRQMTNVMVEGGATLLGALFDADLVDEVHAFIAPKIIGGATAATAVAGHGLAEVARALVLDRPVREDSGGDLYWHGFLRDRVPIVESA